MRRPRLSIRSILIFVAAIALNLGLLSRRLQHQREALTLLRKIGGQFEVPPMGAKTMLTGMTVDNVRFLGPMVGDEDVADIRSASMTLRLNRITLLETRVSDRGLQTLEAGLPDVKIQMITSVPGVQNR